MKISETALTSLHLWFTLVDYAVAVRLTHTSNNSPLPIVCHQGIES